MWGISQGAQKPLAWHDEAQGRLRPAESQSRKSRFLRIRLLEKNSTQQKVKPSPELRFRKVTIGICSHYW